MGVLKMYKQIKLKNIFNLWYSNKIDEMQISEQNKHFFKMLDDKIKNVYIENLLSAFDVVMMANDNECIIDNLMDLFNDNLDTITQQIIEIINQYKNYKITIKPLDL